MLLLLLPLPVVVVFHFLFFVRSFLSCVPFSASVLCVTPQLIDIVRSILDTVDWIQSAQTNPAHPLFGKVALSKGILLAGHSLGATATIYAATAASPGSVAGLFGEGSGNNQICGQADATPFGLLGSPPGNCSAAVSAATLTVPHDLVGAQRTCRFSCGVPTLPPPFFPIDPADSQSSVLPGVSTVSRA